MAQAAPIAVVTGASAGVGRATSRELARRGFDVALVARGQRGLERAAEEVEGIGRRSLAVLADVSDADAVTKAASRVEAELGPVDVWVNDAMTTVFAPTWQVDPEDFTRAISVTFLGQVWGTMAALEHMRPRDRGTIVNVGSALAFVGIPLQSAYCASKFACRGYFESVRSELLHEGSHVRISMVHLPAVNTPQFDWCQTTLDRHPKPVPPIYQPEVCARAIAEVAVNGRRSKVLGAWNKLLVATDTLLPGVGNHYAALAAWESQLTDRPLAADRPDNLHQPADADEDHGAHGMFDHEAGGVLDPAFLKTLPHAAGLFAQAVRRAASDRRQLGAWRRDQRQADR